MFSFCSYSPDTNTEDMALVKLTTTMKYFPTFRIIPLCSEPVDHGTELGTCGMGSKSRYDLVLPDGLQGTRLKSIIN